MFLKLPSKPGRVSSSGWSSGMLKDVGAIIDKSDVRGNNAPSISLPIEQEI